MTCESVDVRKFYAYLDAGMMVFPCHGYTKIPAVTKFLEIPFDPTYDPPAVNHQVLLRNEYLVVDCDPRAYQDKDKSPWRELLKDLELPEDIHKTTFTVRTPRGGYHIYFRKRSEDLVKVKLPEYKGLEFKDRWIMAAGSWIRADADGGPIQAGYIPVCGSPATIADAPRVLLAALKAEPYTPPKVSADFRPDDPVDIERYIKFCQEYPSAVSGQEGEPRTFQLLLRGRDMGLSEAKVYEIALEHFADRCDPVWTADELAVKVSNAFEFAANPPGTDSVQNEFPAGAEEVKVEYHKTESGWFKKDLHNLYQFMTKPVIMKDKKGARVLDGVPQIGRDLRYNMFSHRIVWEGKAPWVKMSPEWEAEADAVHYKGIISSHLRLEYTKDIINDAAFLCAKERAFHPVRDYLDELVWDRKPRLDTWLTTYCGAIDDECTRTVARKTLVAAVARIFRPGCKFDHVLVLEGEQDLGKSYLWSHLASPWFTDAALNIKDKQAIEVMQGSWIIELAEMEAIMRHEDSTTKSFLTRSTDRCRMAWGRNAQDFPRQCIFVGTINPDKTGWLKDRTGNRRYWPVPVTKVDLARIQKDRDQLWAEAVMRFQEGEKLFVDNTDIRQKMRKIVESRLYEDPWLMLIHDHVQANVEKLKVDEHTIQVDPILLYSTVIGGGHAAFGPKEMARMASILHSLGFVRSRAKFKQGYTYTKTVIDDI